MNKNQTQRETQVIMSEEEVEELIKGLPKVPYFGSNESKLLKYQGFWCKQHFVKSTIKCQKHFIAKDNDIFIVSMGKSGTTWLKSLLFAVVNRDKNPIHKSPLLNHNPHELVLGLETHIYWDPSCPSHLLDNLTSPRLLSTHLPYGSLPESIKSKNCKIIYIARNPFDTVVSMYHFALGIMQKLYIDFNPPSIEDYFEDFCKGTDSFGPYFENVLEYWKLSLEQPDTMLFLKYEDLKSDPVPHVNRMAEFIDMPFSNKERKDGVVDDIIELCSFKKMKGLDVNKSGIIVHESIQKKLFFRKGEVGDWTNYFSKTMAEKMNKLMQEKFDNTGLSFDLLPASSGGK